MSLISNMTTACVKALVDFLVWDTKHDMPLISAVIILIIMLGVIFIEQVLGIQYPNADIFRKGHTELINYLHNQHYALP
jgi:hypothetical protein